MNLDDLKAFKEIDTQDMLASIDGLPDQLQTAWDLGQNLPLPAAESIQSVLVAGMGGSAIGADLLSAYAAAQGKAPIFVNRDYDLPAWANGPETLAVASSHSGNTEETLSAFGQAVERNCRVVVATTGGKLAEAAGKAGAPVWKFEHKGQPRAAVGFSFGLLLALLARLGLIPDPEEELRGAVEAMRVQQATINAEMTAAKNPAKRVAGQLVGRWVTVFGSGILAPVARRWKNQISEISKAWAGFEILPEADHNTVAGIVQPEELFGRSMNVFLHSPADHSRNQLRGELTRKIFMLEGLNTDFVEAQGDTALANLWTALHFGDYVSYYLAMAYGEDPGPVPAIEMLKKDLAEA